MSEDVKMETEKSDTFLLSRIFSAHTQDIKCVIGTTSGSIITGSRDECVKLWTERAGAFCETLSIKQRNRLAVNSLAFYQAEDGEWLIFAGLKDGSIEVFNAAGSTPTAVLRNHTANVCTLFVDSARRLLLSGSWDARAVVWNIDNILNGSVELGRELTKHKHSIWAVATLPTESVCFLTASADRTIKLFNECFEEMRTFTGHKDVVRALVVVSPEVFISASNDSTVCVWNTQTGECIQQCESLSGEFIYSLTKLDHKNGKQYIIAGMEKGYVQVWSLQSGQHLDYVQALRVPVESVWSLSSVRSTDLLIGANTGAVYIFTTEESKKANESVLQAFDAEFADVLAREVAVQQSNESDVVTIKVALDDGAPNLELKYTKGEDPTIAAEEFIKKNGLPFSYLNEITEYIKSNIPEARMAEAGKYRRQETQRKSVGGEKFDYAFEVKLSQDGDWLNLGYNIGEDPDYAAQRFVESQHLPIKFIPKISTYLRTEVPELAMASSNPANGNDFVRIGQGASGGTNSNYVDPFTGGGRYVPGGGGGPNASALNGAGGDPLTSGGRYIPSGEVTYTGKVDKKRPRNEFVPIRKFYQFGTEFSSQKIIPKLLEMNGLQPDELKLSEDQIAALNEIITTKATFEANEVHISALRIGLKWSLETIMPILDVFRVALLNKTVNEAFCSSASGAEKSELGNETLDRLCTILISEPSDAIRIFVCRALTNAVVHEPGRRMMMAQVATVAKLLANQLAASKANVQVAAASALANCARLLLMHTEAGEVAELGPREDVLRAIIGGVETVKSFSDYDAASMLRLLQAIATVMWGDSTVIKLGKSRNALTIVQRLKDSLSDQNAKMLCLDITEMLYAVD